MTTIRRLSNSCLTISDDSGTSLLDPGFFTFESGEVDLETIGDVQRVMITHEHADHVKPEFVRWLLDRNSDIAVYANEAVVQVLARHDIEASTDCPEGVSAQDVLHEPTPNGTQPTNRAFTIDGVLTHPGDSYQPTSTAPVLALPLLIPWGSTTRSMGFAKALAPQQVVPIHDFYLSRSGREWIVAMATGVLAQHGIEVVPLDWGESFSV